MDVHPTKNVSIGIDPYPCNFIGFHPSPYCIAQVNQRAPKRAWARWLGPPKEAQRRAGQSFCRQKWSKKQNSKHGDWTSQNWKKKHGISLLEVISKIKSHTLQYNEHRPWKQAFLGWKSWTIIFQQLRQRKTTSNWIYGGQRTEESIKRGSESQGWMEEQACSKPPLENSLQHENYYGSQYVFQDSDDSDDSEGLIIDSQPAIISLPCIPHFKTPSCHPVTGAGALEHAWDTGAKLKIWDILNRNQPFKQQV